MHKKQKEAQRVVRKAVASAKRAITMRCKKAEAELLRLMETDDSWRERWREP